MLPTGWNLNQEIQLQTWLPLSCLALPEIFHVQVEFSGATQFPEEGVWEPCPQEERQQETGIEVWFYPIYSILMVVLLVGNYLVS